MGTFSSFSTAPIPVYDGEKNKTIISCLDELQAQGVIREYTRVKFDKLTVYVGIAKCLAWELSIHFGENLDVCIMDEEQNSFSTFENIN